MRFDHLVMAARDLDRLVAWFTERSGVTPTPGGAHVGLGTRNALVGLGPTSYIELVAIDAEQPEPAGPRPFGIDGLGDRIVVATSAVAVDDLDAAVAEVEASGLDGGTPMAMSRRRPDGVLLEWHLAVPTDPAQAGVVPFSIEWGPTTPHPAASLDHGLTLRSVSVTHPDPTVIAVAAARGLVAAVGPVSLAAELDTPNGVVTLP